MLVQVLNDLRYINKHVTPDNHLIEGVQISNGIIKTYYISNLNRIEGFRLNKLSDNKFIFAGKEKTINGLIYRYDENNNISHVYKVALDDGYVQREDDTFYNIYEYHRSDIDVNRYKENHQNIDLEKFNIPEEVLPYLAMYTEKPDGALSYYLWCSAMVSLL